MAEISSFDESKRQLYLKRSREMLERIDALRSRVSRGEYDDADLAELRSILRSLRYDIVGNDTVLSQAIGLSGGTIAQTYNGRSRPKFPNFLKMLHGAEQLLDREAAVGGNRRLLSPLEEGARPFDQEAGARRDADAVRIRPERSSIFLNDRDLVRVQNIASASNTSISSVVSEALDQYATSGTKRQAKGRAKAGNADQIVIRNRIEIVRYSTAIVFALQEVLDYDVGRHHNSPPPDLRLDEEGYLAEIRNLVGELRRLNALLEMPNKQSVRSARRQVHGFAKHFDKFLSSYANALGKGAAGLTIAAAVGLLYQAGVSGEIIEAIWRHLKRH